MSILCSFLILFINLLEFLINNLYKLANPIDKGLLDLINLDNYYHNQMQSSSPKHSFPNYS